MTIWCGSRPQISDLGPIPERGQQREQSGSLCGGWSGIQSSVLSLLFHNGWPGQALVLCQDNFIRFTAGRGIYSKHRPSHHTSHMSCHNAARLMWGHFMKNFRKHWCPCSAQCSNLMRIFTIILASYCDNLLNPFQASDIIQYIAFVYSSSLWKLCLYPMLWTKEDQSPVQPCCYLLFSKNHWF